MPMSVLLSGLAVGGLFTMIGLAYNEMYASSRVVSMAAGQFGMLGAVFGAWLLANAGVPALVALPAVILGTGLVGLLSELISVRPVLKSMDQHLYVVSTLALGLMLEQAVAIKWGTEPKPFPDLLPDLGSGPLLDDKIWLPIVVAVVAVFAVGLYHRHTLIGRASVAIAEDAEAAVALGIPQSRIRLVSYLIAGALGGLGGFAAGQLVFAYFAIGALLVFKGFVAVAIGGLESAWGALLGGMVLGVTEQSAAYYLNGGLKTTAALVLLLVALIVMPGGVFGRRAVRHV